MFGYKPYRLFEWSICRVNTQYPCAGGLKVGTFWLFSHAEHSHAYGIFAVAHIFHKVFLFNLHFFACR